MLSRRGATITHRMLFTTYHISQKLIGRSMHITHQFGNKYNTLTKKSNYKLTRYSPILCCSFIRSISQESSPINESNVSVSSPITATDNVVQNIPAKSAPTNLFDTIPDAPVPPTPEILDLAASLSEPTLKSLGLGSWWPTGIVQQLLEMLHISCGLPWWETITIGTICMRILMFPLVVRQQKIAATVHNCLPTIQKLQNKVTEARMTGDEFEDTKYSHELMTYSKENKIGPFNIMCGPLIQAPVFLTIFFAVKRMANLPVESMSRGGLYWFEDLTVPDPYYILPLVTSATLFITLKLGVDGPKLVSVGAFRYVIQAMPLLIFPFIINFPAAIVWYWVSTNTVTLLQVAILKIPQIRRYLKIPQEIVHPPNAVEKSKPFIEGMKESWSNMKMQREMTDRAQFDNVQFNKAGRGPIPKTYTYNPRYKQSKKSTA